MSDFERLFNEALVLETSRKKKSAEVQRITNQLREKLRKIDIICRPVCLKAVDKYNSSGTSLQIIPIGLGIAIDFENKILLSVRLNYPTGQEPDESLNFDDIGRVESALRRILEEELKVAGIPLTLGEFTVPTDYYGK